MSPSKLGIFAHLALVASAILIPPTITGGDFGDDFALETLAITPLQRSVTLECPGCALATEEEYHLKWNPDAGNTFLLEFEVGPQKDTINIEGVQLYPPSFSYFTQPFYVTQVNSKSEYNLRLRVTGYHFHYNSAETVSEAGTELLPMTFQITAVEGESMDPPALTINVLKDTEGSLMIASFQTAQAANPTPVDQEKDCNEWPLFCRWKSILGDKMNKLKKPGKGCHKRPHGKPVEEEAAGGQPPHRPHHGKPHHHRPDHMGHGGHHHHRHHRFQTFLRRAFFTVLVPVLIGIFAGTLTYLIGMALGCLVAVIIAKVRGQSYERVALEEDVEESESGDEKEEYAELPAYDSPPVYEEAAEKEVDESK